MLWYQFVVHTGPKANTNKTQTSRFTWFPKTGYIHGGSRLYINGGMIQTLNSTQYNPQKPVFHSYTLFSQIYTCIHSHSCIHLHSPLHSLCLLSSLFYLLFSVFHTRLHEKGKHKYNGWKTEGGWKEEGGWWLLRKMLTICKCRQFATDVTQEDIDNTHKKVNLILNEEFLNRKDYVPHRRDWLSFIGLVSSRLNSLHVSKTQGMLLICLPVFSSFCAF
jgi:hypothetical protein